MVSVILPVYNGGLYIGQAIESILSQTYKDVEIIVVDDGSTDNTERVVRSYENIHYICQDNSGPSAARNKGMAASEGDYIAFLDSDDLYKENKLEEQVKTFEQNKDVDIVYNDCIAVDKDLNYINTLISEGVYENEKDFLCMLLFRQIVPVPASIMLRRKCFEEGCVYSERYKHTEDYEYIIRLAQKYKFMYIPEPLYIYRRHENNLTNAHKIQEKRELDVIKGLGYEKIESIMEQSSFSLFEKKFLLAKIYIKVHEYEIAEEILVQLAKENFEDPHLWFYLGNCCYFTGKYDKAAYYYKTAIQLDVNISEAYNNLSCIYAGKNKTEAVQLLRQALKLRPDYMDAIHNMSQIEIEENDYKITNRELRKVLTNYLKI